MPASGTGSAVSGAPQSEIATPSTHGTECRAMKQCQGATADLDRDYKATDVVDYRGDGAELSKYSHREMARRFAQVLDTSSYAPAAM